MPAYVYKCKTCDFTYEKRKKFTEEHDTECPECGREVRRVINSVGVVFKGSGFYVNDSRSNNSAAPAANGSDTSDKKSDAKSEGDSSAAKPDKKVESKPAEKKTESKPADKAPA